MYTSKKSSDSNKITNQASYYCDVHIPENLEPSKMHIKALEMLMENRRSSVGLEKLHYKKAELCSIRANNKSRIIGTFGPNGSEKNKRVFFVLAFFDNHEYEKLKSKNFQGLQDRLVIEKALEKIAQENFDPKTHGSKVDYINKQAIWFDIKQKDIIHTATSPLIVTGAAGTGKTLIIIKILQNLMMQGDNNKRYLYIAPTKELATQVQKIFNALPGHENMAGHVDFTHIWQFIHDNKRKGHTLTTREDLKRWLTNTTFDDIFDNLLKNPDYLIEEFKSAAILDKDGYLALGETQSLYATKEDRELCYALFTLYKDKNKQSCQFLFPDLKEDKPQYDMVMIDEGQNYTIKQLLACIECAKNGQFKVFGDPLQDFTNKISVLSRLKQILQKQPLIKLNCAYRNSPPIIDVANDGLELRRLLAGGKGDECEALELIPFDKETTNHTPVEWIDTLSDTKKEELKALLSQPNTQVITVDETYRRPAREAFGPDIHIASPQEAQGLETMVVVLFYPFTPSVVEKINARLKQIDTTKKPIHMPSSKIPGTPEFTMDMNKYIVAATRVAQGGRLIIYLGEHKDHHSKLFFDALKKSKIKQPTPTHTPSEQPLPNSIEDWEEWIIRLYASGKKDEAEARYIQKINKDVTGFYSLVGAPIPIKPEPIINQKSVKPNRQKAQPNNKPNNTNTNNSSPAPSSGVNTNNQQPLVQTGFFKPKPDTKNKPAFNVSAYLKILVKMFQPQFVEKSLIEHTDSILVTPSPIRSDEPETLFEIILDNPNFLGVLITVLQKDRWLATGALISNPAPITQVIEKIVSNQCTHQLITLFEILISNQPNLIQAINQDLVSVELLCQLSADETGILALHTLLDNHPNCFDEAINQIAETKNQTCWFSNLLDSHAGCSIVSPKIK